MKFSFETQTDLAAEKIWPLYADVNKWFSWEDDLEHISLEGAFEEGTTGEMTLAGQPPMKFVLTTVKVNQEFTDVTMIPGVGSIYFQHELLKQGEVTLVKHSVEFIPENRVANVEDSKFVAQIFSDVPASIFGLIGAAKNE